MFFPLERCNKKYGEKKNVAAATLFSRAPSLVLSFLAAYLKQLHPPRRACDHRDTEGSESWQAVVDAQWRSDRQTVVEYVSE